MHTLKRIFLPVIIVILLAVLTMPVLGNQTNDNTDSSSTSPLNNSVQSQLSSQIPVLIAPVNNFTSTNPNFDFSWESVSGATQYQIHISYQSNFASGDTYTVSTTSYNYKPIYTITHYWRVRGKNGSTYSPWSSARQFRLQPMSPPPSLAPINTLTVSDPNVMFSWEAITYATGYQIQIGHNNTFFGDNLLHDTTVTSLNYNYVFSAVGTYYWRIRARNGRVEGTWSSVYQLTVQSDSAPNLLAPYNQIISYMPTFVLTWSAVTGATDYNIQIAKNYNFTVLIDQRTTANTTSTYTFSLYDRYYWRVQADDGLWSQPRAMTFAFIPFSDGTTTFVDVNNNFPDFSFRDDGQSILFYDRNNYDFNESDFLTQTTYDLLMKENVSGLGATTNFYATHISSDGRYALIVMNFEGLHGVYRYDRVMGTIALVSKDSNGTPMGSTFPIDISNDGNLILFSVNTMITPSSFSVEPFLHNFQTGQTIPIPTSPSPSLNFLFATISDNNRYLAVTYIPLVVTEGTPTYLYLYNIENQVLQPVMTPNNTVVTTAYLWTGNERFVFYDNDRYVAFNSGDSAFTSDPNFSSIVIYDTQTGLFQSVPITINVENNRYGIFQDISPDGRYVVFYIYIFGALNRNQLYVYDRQTGTTTHVSVNSAGVAGTLATYPHGRVSHDGSFVAFNGSVEHYGILRHGIHVYTLPSSVSSVAFGQGAFSPARLSAVGSGSLTTEFRWTPIRGILDYQIQIATDNEFNTILYDVDVNTTSHTQTFPQTGTYYWRVRGENSWGDGLWSDTFHIIIGEGATVVIDEQHLFTMAQPHLTHDITSVLFDITPTGIFTTTQFGNGAVVTAIIRLPLINGLIRVTTESVVGGNATQQSAIYEAMPALLLTILDERLPDNYLVVESIGLTGSTITMNIVLPSNP